MTATMYRKLILHPAVFYYHEIRKYSPGVKVEKDGLFTQRIVVDSQYYSLEAEAVKHSVALGQQLIDRHISAKEELYFEYSE